MGMRKKVFKKLGLVALSALLVSESMVSTSIGTYAYDDEAEIAVCEENDEADSDEMQVDEASESTEEFQSEESIEVQADSAISPNSARDDYPVLDEWCGDNVKWAFDVLTGEGVAYGQGEMYNYPGHLCPWADYEYEHITKLVISDGITYIGNHSFSACNNIKELLIADSVRAIGKEALRGITLNEADIYILSLGLETIGEFAFAETYLANEIIIPENVKKIDDFAFAWLNKETKKITFLGDMPELGNLVFWNGDFIVYYPADNETWTSEKVKEVSEESEVIFLPVGTEEPAADEKCGDNITWKITGETEKVLELHGFGDMYDYTYGAHKAPWRSYSGKISKVVMDPRITSIGSCAFYKMKFEGEANEDNDIILPKRLSRIGECAFRGVEDRYIVYPDSVEIIEYCAFERSAVRNIGNLPDDLRIIGEFAFCECNIDEITIPATVEKIEKGAFQCTPPSYPIWKRKNINAFFLGNVPELAESTFHGRGEVAFYYLPENETWKNYEVPEDNLGALDLKLNVLSTYNVVFTDPYGNEFTKSYIEGTAIDEPDVQLNEGDEIIGWYREDENFPGFQTSFLKWSFNKINRKDIKLTARLKGADCKVRFITNSQEEIPDQVVKAGEKVSIPELEDREDCTFIGWSQDEKGAQPFDSDKAVYEDLILHSIWDYSTKGIAVTATDMIYAGKPLNPVVSVSYDGKILKANKDYIVKCKDNTNVGTGTYTVILKGAYKGKGTASGTFEISPVNMNDRSKVWPVKDTIVFTYDRKNHKGKTQIKANLDGKIVTLKEHTDYEYYWYNNYKDFRRPGFTNIEIWGMGNYEGMINIKQMITEDETLSSVKVEKIASYKYTGEAIEPLLTVSYKKRPLTLGEHYTVSYKNNVEPGKATVILRAIPGKGYIGTKEVTFDIIGIYQVVLDANGGEQSDGNSLVSMSLGRNESYRLNGKLFNRPGYKLSYWSKIANPDPKDKKIALNATLKNAANHGETYTLYAIWQPLSYKISYDLTGGKQGKNAKRSYKTGESVLLPIPTKKGYTFMGWEIKKKAENTPVGVTAFEGVSTAQRLSDNSYGDVSLKAIWEKNEVR